MKKIITLTIATIIGSSAFATNMNQYTVTLNAGLMAPSTEVFSSISLGKAELPVCPEGPSTQPCLEKSAVGTHQAVVLNANKITSTAPITVGLTNNSQTWPNVISFFVNTTAGTSKEQPFFITPVGQTNAGCITYFSQPSLHKFPSPAEVSFSCK